MNGIYLLANDVAFDWTIAAIESIRAHGCTLPICVIPFSARTERVEKLAPKYGFQVWHGRDLEKLDELGLKFCAAHPVSVGHFRRFASFWGPFDHFIYADVDIVALINWDELLNTFVPSGSRFWYFGLSEDWVYKPGPLLDELRRQGRGVCFSGGIFVSSRDVITFERMQELTEPALAVREQLAEAGDQPFFNFYMDHERIPVDSVTNFIPDLYAWNWADSTYEGRSDLYEIADRTGSFNGKRFPCVHWAGSQPCSYMPQMELYLKYRLMDAPVADRTRIGWEYRVRPWFGNWKRRVQGKMDAAAM